MSGRIALTGASGLVGGALLRVLSAEGYEVLALARAPARLPLPRNAQAVACDLENISPEAADAVAAFAPGIFIHAGWIGTENTERNDPHFAEANIDAGMRLLSIAAEAGCKRWIGFGSQAEYSPNIDSDISETSPADPDTNYGIAKLALCQAQQVLCEGIGIDFLWLRLFTCYGRDYKPTYVIPYLIDRLTRGEMPELKTPHAVWDCLHVKDAAEAVLKALASRGAKGIYNLAYGQGVSVGDMALILAEHLRFSGIEALRAGIAANKTPATRRAADTKKFRRDFGWTPRIDIRSGLKSLLP